MRDSDEDVYDDDDDIDSVVDFPLRDDRAGVVPHTNPGSVDPVDDILEWDYGEARGKKELFNLCGLVKCVS